MPVGANTPEPLKKAVENMEESVQRTKADLSYCAPEVQDEKWAALQRELAGQMETLYKSIIEG